ncbi:MAG: ester cyclase [Pseudonocardia sp.]|nr:ester cyclase [Pseudonocardia sp.]
MTPGMQVLMRQMEELRDRFCSDLFDRADADAALAAMTPGVTVAEIPSGAGGNGIDEVRRYLCEDFLPHLPADLTRTRISRTLDTRKLVDEVEFTFTHDRELPWLLPGVAPTGRSATVLALSVVRIRQNRIDSVRTLWDEAGLRRALRSPAA